MSEAEWSSATKAIEDAYWAKCLRPILQTLRANGNRPTPAIELFGQRSSAMQSNLNARLAAARTGIKLVQFDRLGNAHHLRRLALARMKDAIREP